MVHAIIYILTALIIFSVTIVLYLVIDRWFFKPSNPAEATRTVRIPWWYWPILGVIGIAVMVVSSYVKSGHMIGGRFTVEMVIGQMLGAIVFGKLSLVIFKKIKPNTLVWIPLLFFPIAKACGPLLGAAIMILLGYKPGLETPIGM